MSIFLKLNPFTFMLMKNFNLYRFKILCDYLFIYSFYIDTRKIQLFDLSMCSVHGHVSVLGGANFEDSFKIISCQRLACNTAPLRYNFCKLHTLFC